MCGFLQCAKYTLNVKHKLSSGAQEILKSSGI